jgi:trimeric autotransporter adhesin
MADAIRRAAARLGGTRRRVVIAVIVVAVLAAGAGSAYAALAPAAPAYRLATVTTAQVTATLTEVGTLTPVQQASVAFSASGTVATVPVLAGQQVTAGQTLGTLDTTPLEATLTAAQSALANARLRVDNDIAGENAAAGPAASGAGGSSAPDGLQALQQGVLSGQRAVDTALGTTTTALAQARQACGEQNPGSGGTHPSPSPDPSPSRAPSPSAAPPSSPAPSPSPSPSPVSCASAEQHVLADETAASRAEQALAGQLTALGTALSQDSGADPAGGGVQGATADSAGASDAGGTVTAQQLAADQEAADAAADQVTIAQQSLAGATAVSPVTGTVVSVSPAAGASVTAGTPEFQVAGLGSWEVVAQVPVADMPQVAVGEPASVLADGSTSPVSGEVVTVGLSPASGSNPVTYPVTISLLGQPSGLHDGGYAGVTITTSSSGGVSVPTSAVHYSGGRATVTVYAAGAARTVRVTVGTKGPVLTRITSGLAARQQVVLANLNAPLPSGNPSSGSGGGVVFVGRAGQFQLSGS